MFKLPTTCALFFLALSCTPVFGQVFLEYQTGAATAAGLAPTTAIGVTGSNVLQGGGLTANAGGNFSWRDWEPASADFNTAISQLDFLSWGFIVDSTPAPATLMLTNFQINVDRSGSGPDDFEIRASVNAGPDISLLTHSFNGSSSTANFTVSLASLPLLTNGDQVEFQLGAFTEVGDPAGSALGTLSLPNDGGFAISTTGEFTVVPEPATATLLALGCVGVGLTRRRRA